VIFVAVVIAMNSVARYVANIFPIAMNFFIMAVVMRVFCWLVVRFIMRSVMAVVMTLVMTFEMSFLAISTVRM